MSNRTADIIILGAGVIGSSIAFHLAKRKPGRIVVLEKSDVAFGGSGRSSALVRMHYSFPPEVELAKKSLDIFENWQEIVGTPGHFRKTGFIRIVLAEEIERLHANVQMQRQLGVNTSVLSREELRKIEPHWNFDDVPAAAYEPDSGYGDGAGVANDFLTAAREMGVSYFSRTRISSLKTSGGRITGVKTDSGSWDAPVVIAATGPWSRPLFAEAGVDLPIDSEYHQVGFLRNPPELKSSCACIDSILAIYFRSEAGGFTLIGGFYGPRGMDPDQFPESTSEEKMLEMALLASQRIPALENASIARGVTGMYDVTPDYRPLLGEIPGISGLYIAAGFSGMGFKISPAIGLVLSELVLDGIASTIDIRAFRPNRFADGEPIRAPFEYQAD